MNFKAIFFDLDGTLLNTLPDLHAACNYALKKNGFKEVTIKKVEESIGDGIRKLNERLLPQGSSDELIDKAMNDFSNYYIEHVDVYTIPYEGIIEVLTKLKEKGYIIVIVSNKFYAGVQKLNDKFFTGLVDLALGPNETLKTKPDLSMINYALEYFNLTKEEVLYVGDSNVDVVTAIKSGFEMLTVTYGYKSKEELIKLGYELKFIDKPVEILKYIGE